MKHLTTRRRHAPPGFTMMELMVVVGIIAFLAGISFMVIGSMLVAAKETATRTTIAKIDGLLKQQITDFYTDLDPRSPETRALAGKFRSFPYNLTDDRDTSTVLATKAAYLRRYPQNLYEAAGFDRLPETADDIPLFLEWLIDHHPESTGYNPENISEADSIELLYLAMTEGKVTGITPVSRDDFNASETGDTDGDGWIEFLDAWGNPLRFYRWPTRLVNPLGFRANILANDIDNSETTLELNDASAFQNNLPTPFRVVVGREIIEIESVSGNTLNVTTNPTGRGAQNTNPTAHSTGDKVRLAPFTEVATLLLGFVNSDILAKDPDDKFGSISELHSLSLLTSGTLPPGDVLANIDKLADPPFVGEEVTDYELVFHTLDSYHAPLIVSAGEDGELGLVEPGYVKMDDTNPTVPDPMERRNPRNIWIPRADLNGNGTPEDWRWGTLAQPYILDSDGNPDYSILANPGSSPLNDNLTNYNGSN